MTHPLPKQWDGVKRSLKEQLGVRLGPGLAVRLWKLIAFSRGDAVFPKLFYSSAHMS
jgi:hypothetical protein